MKIERELRSLSKYGAGLGLVFGAGLGVIIGAITSINIELAVIVGAGVGLIIGSMIAGIKM